MARTVFSLLILLLLTGCTQTVHTAKVADTIEIEVHDDGTMSYLNSSTLYQDWEDQAKKECPQGYTILRQHYYKEEPFIPSRIDGAVQCR
ncbi:MAG: hypothetical protein PHD01_11445 [Geobacteraceae bacterium]|nr:hypothetical protein [Geobacteraceae bacterium]